MDGFTAGLMFFVICLCGAFALGTWNASPDMAEKCNKQGEITIRAVVYECKAVAGIINGKRVELSK